MSDCEFDDAEMFELLELVMKSPDFDSSKATASLDKLYQYGEMLQERDLKKALKFYRRAAKLRYPYAAEYVKGIEAELAAQKKAKKTPRVPRAKLAKKLRWWLKMAWRNARKWKRSCCREQCELDAFRKCAMLERKLEKYPRAVPLLTELMNAYKATGQEGRRLEIMRRLRDIDGEPKPAPDFVWVEQPPVYTDIFEARCAKIGALIREQRMESIHLNHVQNVLGVSADMAKSICDALAGRGMLGQHDKPTNRYSVLVSF